MKEREGEITT